MRQPTGHVVCGPRLVGRDVLLIDIIEVAGPRLWQIVDQGQSHYLVGVDRAVDRGEHERDHGGPIHVLGNRLRSAVEELPSGPRRPLEHSYFEQKLHNPIH
jgi:hypothetical protein